MTTRNSTPTIQCPQQIPAQYVVGQELRVVPLLNNSLLTQTDNESAHETPGGR